MCLFVCLALKVARACQACQRDSMNGTKRYIDPSYLPINVSTGRQNYIALAYCKELNVSPLCCIVFPNTRCMLPQECHTETGLWSCVMLTYHPNNFRKFNYYSWPRLVLSNTEELISRSFVGKI